MVGQVNSGLSGRGGVQWQTYGQILGATLLFCQDEVNFFYCFRAKDYCLQKYWGHRSPLPSGVRKWWVVP